MRKHQLYMIIYTYKNCSTCRKAVKWLHAEEIEFEEKPIRETPPSEAELHQMLEFQNGELKKLFNTAGVDYRELDLKNKLQGMSLEGAIKLLASRGNLVKRPFLLSDSVGLVGFKEAIWAEKLSK